MVATSLSRPCRAVSLLFDSRNTVLLSRNDRDPFVTFCFFFYVFMFSLLFHLSKAFLKAFTDLAFFTSSGILFHSRTIRTLKKFFRTSRLTFSLYMTSFLNSISPNSETLAVDLVLLVSSLISLSKPSYSWFQPKMSEFFRNNVRDPRSQDPDF